jgi:glycerol uptake facilitator-like aquaporin
VEFWTWLSSRPSWQRVARVSEQLIADAIITIVFMIVIYLVSVVARQLHVDKEEIVSGFTIAHMIHWLHAANFAINGYYALRHLIAAHRTSDED